MKARVAVIAIVLHASAFTTASAVERYSVTEVPGLSGSWTFAAAMNEAGTVTGSSASRAVLYDSATLNLGTLPGTTSSDGRGINAARTVVGNVNNPNGAFIWRPGIGMTQIPSPSGTVSAAAISDAGVVTGHVAANGILNTFAFDSINGGALEFVPPLVTGASAQGTAINASGQIAGFSKTVTGPSGPTHATRASRSPFKYATTDLGTLGGRDSLAWGINNAGDVVGQSLTATGAQQPFLYRNGTMRAINGLNGGDSAATDINNRNVIVGWTLAGGTPYPDSGARAFVATMTRLPNGNESWTTYNLNNLIDRTGTGANVIAQSAVAVNDAGWILVRGLSTVPPYLSHSYLLKPIGSQNAP